MSEHVRFWRARDSSHVFAGRVELARSPVMQKNKKAPAVAGAKVCDIRLLSSIASVTNQLFCWSTSYLH